MVYKKIVYLGLIILAIILICLIYKNRLIKSYENFVCSTDTSTRTHLEEYYNRCINVYKIEERDGTVPQIINGDDNSGRRLVNYYLNQNHNITDHNDFTQFGIIDGTNNGWVNQINKTSIIPEWAYYLFKLHRLAPAKIAEINNVIPNHNDAYNYYNNSYPANEYLNDFNSLRFHSENEKNIHK